MTNVKFTELPSGTTPDGTEVFALVQSSTSVQLPLTTVLDRQLLGKRLFPRTVSEISASVTPTNYYYSDAQREQGSIKRFGAICDGTTDDKLAFQAAVDSCPATGGYIFVPGNTLLSGQILILNKKGITIEIERASIITFTDGSYSGFLFQGGQQHRITGGSIYGSNHSAGALI